MMQIFLIRHSEATGQELDAPLTEVGVQQSNELATKLVSLQIKTLLSSDATRAIETVRPFADLSSLKIKTDPRLRERELGRAGSDDWREVLRRTFEDIDLKYPGGESSREAMQRGRAVVDEACASLPFPIAVATHGALLTLLAKSFQESIGFDFWQALKNPDVFELSVGEEPLELKRL